MKMLVFWMLLAFTLLLSPVHAQQDKPCSQQNIDALLARMDANAKSGGDARGAIDKAINSAIVAHDCEVAHAKDVDPISPDQARRMYEAMDAAMHDPVKVKLMECIGVKVYEDPQPEGHPPSERDCRSFLRSQGANPDDYSPLKG